MLHISFPMASQILECLEIRKTGFQRIRFLQKSLAGIEKDRGNLLLRMSLRFSRKSKRRLAELQSRELLIVEEISLLHQVLGQSLEQLIAILRSHPKLMKYTPINGPDGSSPVPRGEPLYFEKALFDVCNAVVEAAAPHLSGRTASVPDLAAEIAQSIDSVGSHGFDC